MLYYAESEWSLRLNINARAFMGKRNLLTFSRINRDEAPSVYIYLFRFWWCRVKGESHIFHVIRRHNDYISVKTRRLRGSYFLLTLDISMIAMMVQRWRKLEISLYFSSHMKQCAQSLLWMLYAVYFSYAFYDIHNIISRLCNFQTFFRFWLVSLFYI